MESYVGNGRGFCGPALRFLRISIPTFEVARFRICAVDVTATSREHDCRLRIFECPLQKILAVHRGRPGQTSV
eukprot:974153-Rhodomonas_salina.1